MTVPFNRKTGRPVKAAIGRPRLLDENRRDARANVRYTIDELDIIERAATSCNTCVSDWIRKSSIEAAKKVLVDDVKIG